ncbi:MAG TPA: HD domain-containing protein [Deltaproteobacteria bacterium]|nr:HD domain-containing protein [Deltaproteobacteria bacterium]HPR54852.1 HD domain-containing protein [Deltaproteobacteria bacterium]HXK46523.1 HD domain-containing protein [Deltaproteobacteria bacterium]
MDVFRPIPIDVILIDEQSVVDLYINHEDRLVPFLGKGGVFTRDHLMELNRHGLSKLFIRGSESLAFEDYISSHSGSIITDPTVPSRVKAATFYVSSINALRKAFDNPDWERMAEIKQSLKPMLKSIMKNEILLSDLFSITEHDFETYTHSVNVGIYATSLAIQFYKGDSSVGTAELERLSYGYFLHDIGKSRVPLNVLRKRGSLSEEEWVIMKKHPEWGYAILMDTGNLTDEAAYISMQHHERPDGTGYPLGMKDIHPCARICTMADIFDALTSARPYKPPMRPFDALETIKKEAFTEFDHNLLTTFIRMLGPGRETTH